MKPGSLTTRTQAGLNLLSCIDTLVKRCPSGVHVTKDDERSSEQAYVFTAMVASFLLAHIGRLQNVLRLESF